MPRTVKKKSEQPIQPITPAAPQPEAAPIAAPVKLDLPVVYDKLNITEFSTASQGGPLTAEVLKAVLGWETEDEYQKRMVEEDPTSKPEHWLFREGEVHCKDTFGRKVRTYQNAHNRPFDDAWCDKLTAMILKGQWAGPHTIPGETINGETVRVSKYGRVISGQHQGTACIKADEFLQNSRKQLGVEATDEKYPAWKGQEHCFIETILITGLSEDPRVLMTVDYNKPRSAADVFYTSDLFKNSTPAERKELCRMLAVATDFLWTRTDAKGYKTHPELVGFVERHMKLLDCVLHLFAENKPLEKGGRKISKLRLSPGQCSALMFIMASSGPKTESDFYRNEMPPTQKNLDWSYWDKAAEFWVCLGSAKEFMPVRKALGRLVGDEPGEEEAQSLGGRLSEKLAILSNAWAEFKDCPPSSTAFSEDDLADGGLLALSYSDLDDSGKKMPDGKIKLVDIADFEGIDVPEVIVKKSAKDAQTGKPMAPAPTQAEIEAGTAEALRQRQEKEPAGTAQE